MQKYLQQSAKLFPLVLVYGCKICYICPICSVIYVNIKAWMLGNRAITCNFFYLTVSFSVDSKYPAHAGIYNMMFRMNFKHNNPWKYLRGYIYYPLPHQEYLLLLLSYFIYYVNMPFILFGELLNLFFKTYFNNRTRIFVLIKQTYIPCLFLSYVSRQRILLKMQMIIKTNFISIYTGFIFILNHTENQHHYKKMWVL